MKKIGFSTQQSRINLRFFCFSIVLASLTFISNTVSAQKKALIFDDEKFVRGYELTGQNVANSFLLNLPLKLDKVNASSLVTLSYLDITNNLNLLHVSISENGALILNLENTNDVFISESNAIGSNSCHFFGLGISNDSILVFVDNNKVLEVHVPNLGFERLVMLNIGSWNSSLRQSFDGELLEIRLWNYMIYENEISAYNHVPISNSLMPLVYFPIIEGVGSKMLSYGQNKMIMVLGGDTTFNQHTPYWDVSDCFQFEFEPVFVERQGTGYVPCIPEQTGCNLICNGNFEQYDPIISQSYGNNFNGMINFIPDANNNSDVPGWYSVEYSTLNTGIPAAWYYNRLSTSHFTIPILNNIGVTPVETSTGPLSGNDAVARIHTSMHPIWYSPNYGELTSNLRATLRPNENYSLSFNSHVSPTFPNLDENAAVDIFIQSGTNRASRIFVARVNLTRSSDISSLNGWEVIQRNILIPSNAINYDKLVIVGSKFFENGTQTWSEPHKSINVGLDNLRLETVDRCCDLGNNDIFVYNGWDGNLKVVTAIHGSKQNELTSITRNGIGNINLANPVKSILNVDTNGSVITKQCDGGEIVWAKYLPGLKAVDVEEDNNGNVYIVGYYTGYHIFSINNGEYYVTLLGGSTPSGFIAKLNSINGELIWLSNSTSTNGFVFNSLVIDNTGNLFVSGVSLHDQVQSINVNHANNAGIYNNLNVVKSLILKINISTGITNGHTLYTLGNIVNITTSNSLFSHLIVGGYSTNISPMEAQVYFSSYSVNLTFLGNHVSRILNDESPVNNYFLGMNFESLSNGDIICFLHTTNHARSLQIGANLPVLKEEFSIFRLTSLGSAGNFGLNWYKTFGSGLPLTSGSADFYSRYWLTMCKAPFAKNSNVSIININTNIDLIIGGNNSPNINFPGMRFPRIISFDNANGNVTGYYNYLSAPNSTLRSTSTLGYSLTFGSSGFSFFLTGVNNDAINGYPKPAFVVKKNIGNLIIDDNLRLSSQKDFVPDDTIPTNMNRVYPNPNSGEFLYLNNYVQGSYVIRNTIGAIVERGNFYDSKLSLNQLSSGLYFIDFNNSNKWEKVIVKR